MNEPLQNQPSKEEALASISGLTDKKNQLPREFLGSAGLGDCKVSAPEKISCDHSIDEIFVYARTKDASDVHLSADTPIIIRRFGSLEPQTQDNLPASRLEEMIKAAFAQNHLQEFRETGDAEFIYTLTGSGRYRVTLIKQRLGWDLTARLIPATIRTLEEANMPASCQQLTKWAQGLVLISGPAGCGKTSSLATLVEIINQTRNEHIITIEDPIEVVYTPKQCQITQREIHRHTLSQANALKAALREDPDIIVVGELRDLESIQLAVTAAETGHLVFGTMNTNNASQTISSLINSFPPDEQSIITNMISESLRGVICQQLIPKKDGSGVAPAFEVLILKTAVANMIRKGNLKQINNAITTGKSEGMILFDDSLRQLIVDDIITIEEAQKRAIDKNSFSKGLSSQGLASPPPKEKDIPSDAGPWDEETNNGEN